MLKHKRVFSGFSVIDASAAKKFYKEKLGLLIEDVPGMDGIFNLKLNEQNSVVVYAKPNHTPASFTILNIAVNDIESAVDELNAAGIRPIIYNEENFKTDDKGIFRGGGPLIAWFNDPSGNIISVMEA